MSTQNLIEIQSNLQDPAAVKMQDLINYANGSNPEVPSFLALIEMNRRKQIEQTAKAFNSQGEQGTIKDQTVNALMGRQQMNPTAAPQGINPTAAPAAFSSTGMQRQVLPGQAPQQVDPTAPMQAAEGGLMSIPVKHFKEQSFASGGIVAFKDGGEADEYSEEKATRRADYEERKEPLPPRAKYKLGGQEILGPRSTEEIQRGLPSIAPMQGMRPGDITPEQAYQRNKEIEKMAGVSQDPYADVRKRQEAIEARQAEEYKGNAIDRLIAQAEAFGNADPSRGFGYAAAASSKASRALAAEQRAIRDKQEALNLDIARNMAEKDDARRRGDAAGVKSAMAQVKQDQAEYDKLQMKHDELATNQFKTASDIRTGDVAASKLPMDIYSAETQRKNVENMAEHQRQTRELAELTKPTADDITYNRLMGKVNQDPEIKMLAARLKDHEPGSDEYAQIQAMMYNKMKTIFSQHPGLLPPPPEQMAPLNPPEKKKSFDERFREAAGSGWFPGKSSSPGGSSAPRTVSFDQLPK